MSRRWDLHMTEEAKAETKARMAQLHVEEGLSALTLSHRFKGRLEDD